MTIETPLTKSEHIRRTIQDDIDCGRLRPGDPIKLDEQAARFGSTAIPVREALRALQAERLVTLRPHHTALVAEVDLIELKDIYSVRAVIEADVMRRATVNLSACDVAQLQKLARLHQTSVRGGQKRTEAHQLFHCKLYELAGSPTLTRIALDLWRSSERCRRLLRSGPPPDGTNPADDHLALVTALQSGSAERAAETMVLHLARSLERLRSAFAGQEAAA